MKKPHVSVLWFDAYPLEKVEPERRSSKFCQRISTDWEKVTRREGRGWLSMDVRLLRVVRTIL